MAFRKSWAQKQATGCHPLASRHRQVLYCTRSSLKLSKAVVKMMLLGRDLQFPSFGVVGLKLLENLSVRLVLSYGGTQHKGKKKSVCHHIFVYSVLEIIAIWFFFSFGMGASPVSLYFWIGNNWNFDHFAYLL